MGAILLACAAMALKDALGTVLVIAEARGRALLAGILDAASDLALVLVTLAGAGEVIVHGWSWRTGGILAAMMLTSFGGTIFWTRVGTRLLPVPPAAVPVSLPDLRGVAKGLDHEARLARLEAATRRADGSLG